jgi:hypothetical protein
MCHRSYERIFTCFSRLSLNLLYLRTGKNYRIDAKMLGALLPLKKEKDVGMSGADTTLLSSSVDTSSLGIFVAAGILGSTLAR